MRPSFFLGNPLFFWASLGLPLFFLSGGCQSTPLNPKDIEFQKIPRVQKIKVGGNGTIILGEMSPSTLALQPFIQKLSQLLQEEKFLSAQHHIERFPYLTLEALRNLSQEQALQAPYQFMAKVYDHRLLSSSSQGWYPLIQARLRSPEPYRIFDQQRQALLKKLQEGRFSEAAQGTLNTDLEHVFLKIQAAHLNGISFLLEGQNEKALASFQEAIQGAKGIDAYQEAHILLLQSECFQRLEQPENAQKSWENAVTLANTALQGSALEDPVFWDRALQLKTPSSSWPSDLFQKTSPLPFEVLGDIASRSNSLVWEYIGHWKLRSNDGQAALVAFRKSLALERNPFYQVSLELAQCRALILLKQGTSANSTLLKITQNSHPPFASAALALLGVLELQREETQRGLGLMLRALEKTSENWQGKDQALADLGLAFLIAGADSEGLHHLHLAQAQFRNQEKYDQLLQSLHNELSYFECLGERTKSTQLQKNIQELERSQLKL
jgi:hypothetical protein